MESIAQEIAPLKDGEKVNISYVKYVVLKYGKCQNISETLKVKNISAASLAKLNGEIKNFPALNIQIGKEENTLIIAS
ncbi:MAG: hypothetical protein ABIF80_04160 [Patescibacteria group bacterium]